MKKMHEPCTYRNAQFVNGSPLKQYEKHGYKKK